MPQLVYVYPDRNLKASSTQRAGTGDATLLVTAPSVEPDACHQTVPIVGANAEMSVGAGDEVGVGVGRGTGARVGDGVGNGVGPVGIGVGWNVESAHSQL